ncbi:MAG: TetR/AcrR family transcriptional regulator [Myxococcaceae bacterium]
MSVSLRKTGDEGSTRTRGILEAAARLICARGYEGTSIQEIADACSLTKAGLYHHIESKEHLLLAIQNYGMDIFETEVLSQVLAIADPVERLRSCMELNIRLVTGGRHKEVLIILHEHDTLTGEARAHVNARKKRYVHVLEDAFREAIAQGRMRHVEPKVAAFAFLGQVLWIYKWYHPGAGLSEEQVVRGMLDLFFTGLLLKAPHPA